MFHSANVLPDGSVLVLGATAASGAIAQPEGFDPASGRFRSAGPLGLIPRVWLDLMQRFRK